LATWIVTLHGRHGTYGTGLPLVARLGPIWRRGRRGCLRGRHLATSTFTGAAVCVAGVALGNIDRHFAWQVWHLWHLWHWAPSLGSRLVVVAAAVCVAGVAIGYIELHFAWQVWHLATSTFTLRGRCGTWRHRPSLCVAGVALGDIDPGRALATAVCVAGVALGDMDLHFAWQVVALKY